MRFSLGYFLFTAILLLIEILIGAYAHDNIVRPFVGDFLVVILIYCFMMSFFTVRNMAAALGVLIFACTIEVTQYYHLVYVLRLGSSRFARIIMGTSFSWMDMLMYTLGIILVVAMEMFSGKPIRIRR